MKIYLNEVRIEGNVAFVKMERGNIAKVSLEDLHKIKSLKWEVKKIDGVRHPVTVFVRRHRPRKMIKMSKYITGLDIVDHLDGDTMNNTKKNLAVLDPQGKIQKHKDSIQEHMEIIQEHKQAIQQLEQVTN